MLEKEIEAYMSAQVKARGGRSYKFVSPAHRGVSDRIVIMPGASKQPAVVWFVEVKTEVGRLSPLQEIFRRDINNLGGNYMCVYGKKDVDLWLASL
jgi:hypothetical protein